MSTFAFISLLFGFGLFYTFTCVLAYRFFMYINWRDAADSPLTVIWPIVLLFHLILMWPLWFFLWLTKTSAKRAKAVNRRRKHGAREVK